MVLAKFRKKGNWVGLIPTGSLLYIAQHILAACAEWVFTVTTLLKATAHFIDHEWSKEPEDLIFSWLVVSNLYIILPALWLTFRFLETSDGFFGLLTWQSAPHYTVRFSLFTLCRSKQHTSAHCSGQTTLFTNPRFRLPYPTATTIFYLLALSAVVRLIYVYRITNLR